MSSSAGLSGSRIRHAVVFALPHVDGSPEETSFLTALAALGSIEGVEEFEVVREVSAKNDYRWGVSMEFVDQSAYDAYNDDPRHVGFVRDRWVPEVTHFLEVDFAPRG